MPHDTPAAMYASRQLEEKLNAAGGPITLVDDPVLRMVAEYVLYIYNIGPMSHPVHKGSAGPAGGYKIPACEKGKPFSRPLIIPSIVVDTYIVENEIKTHAVTGEFMCQDIVHPMIGQNWSIGQNLDDFGVFWTRNNPPTQDELDAARFKMEKTFREALTEANMLEATNRLGDITPLMRFAASYYEEDRPWNRIYRKTAECPVCGGPTKLGITVHTCGAVLDWEKAIAFGLKTPKDAELAGVTLNGAKAATGQDLINQLADTADGLARSENMAKKLRKKPKR